MAPLAQDLDHSSTASHTYTSSNDRKLKVIIIGAGIAGLSAAIGLRYAGHDVEVFCLSHRMTLSSICLYISQIDL